MGEVVWVANIAGRSLTGRQGDRGAPLLHITFHETEETSPPARELLVVGTTLDVYADEELPTLLARSRPYQEPKPADRPKRRDRGRGRP